MSDDSEIILAGKQILNRAQGFRLSTNFIRKFRGFFGVSQASAEQLWDLLSVNLPTGCKPEHLLWTLMFLKVYATEEVLSALASSDPKTLRKWIWIVIPKNYQT